MKKTSAVCGVLAALCCAAASAVAETQPLWPSLEKMPDRQAFQIAAMTDVSKAPGFVPDAHRMPYIEWNEPPASPNGACMLLVSGGSYNVCCDVKLVEKWRVALTEAGFQTVKLVYRTPRPKGLPIHQTAWEDGQRAIRLVRSQAAKRGFRPDRIGAIGMSAGGHLVCMLATSSMTPAYERVDELDDVSCELNICIANAPAYNTAAAASGIARPEDGRLVLDPEVSPFFKFDAKTCPISFHHGADDSYTPSGSTRCYREMRKIGVPSELHLYADKKHCAPGLDAALEFMHQMDFDGKLGDETERRIFTGANTAEQVREALWPEGKMPNVQSVQTNAPYLTWYIPKTLSTKAIQVLFPGGGYMRCNATGEGLPVAEYLNGRGMAVVVVMYRCPRPNGLPKHLTAWQDAQRAIRIVRSEAPARGLDPDRIGVMGFSAGGHLTLMASLSSTYNSYKAVDDIDKIPCNVQWACPIYPAYVLTDGAQRPNVTRGNADWTVPVPEFLFDVKTPPMCFMHGDADVWASMNSVKIWERLRRMGIQCDLHTLAKRGHCFQFKAADGTGSANWLDKVWDFLTRKGFNR